MNRLLVILCFIVAVGITVAAFPDSGVAMLIVGVFSAITIFIIRRTEQDRDFLVQLFLVALIVRLLVGIVIHIFELREFFGGDALLYDTWGYQIVKVWFGQVSASIYLSQVALSLNNPNWGMNYLTAVIYVIVGRNILAAQFFCAVIGAATVPVAYHCSHNIFNNRRVGKITAFFVALFPAFVIWSCQLLKDGIMIFLLVLAMTMVIKLQKRFDYLALIILIFSLFCILSLRFYIFYMVAIAVVGSFVIGLSSSGRSIIRNLIAIAVIGLALTYLGVLRNAEKSFGEYGSLERIQVSRGDLAQTSSGFGKDIDVTTTSGAISALPVGFIYLMLAPFPWQITNFRQAITLPDVLAWWLSIPILLSGFWYTVKHRLRAAISILIFSVMLMLAYSLFQGNVGTAYRQRTQIQVFLFMFVAVGWTLIQEKRENKKMLRLEKRNQIGNRIQQTSEKIT